MMTVFFLEYRGFRKRKQEYRELEHFAEFLSDLKYEFFLCKNITESIFRASEKVPGNLRKRLEKICFLLESEESEPEVAEYQYPTHLKHLKLFLIQCRNAVQYGSGKNSTESVFVKNMTELRRDVQNECHKRMQSGYLFAGTGLVSAVPLAFLPAVKYWGSATMDELRTFYDGTAGRVTAIALGAVTLGCYWLIGRIREMGHGRKETTRGYLGYLRKLGMESEVLGLQSVVLLLMNVPNITMLQILDALEGYADLFRTTIARCTDRYGAEEAEALEELRTAENCPAFCQFAGQIIVSERIGLARAFSEIAADRNFFREQQRLHTEQELKKKAANAQVIAFLPLVFLLFAYLIFPFLIASLGQMGEIFREMEQIRYF